MQFGQSAINVVLNEGQLPVKYTTDASGATALIGAGGRIDNLAMGIPPGLDWLSDTLHGFDIYSKGFVRTPTMFFDPSATSSLGRGTFANPYTTQAELMAAVSGNMAGQVIGFKRGTTLRATGSAGLNLDLYGTSAKPVIFCPYGDAEALPIITGAAIYTDWTVEDAGANIWKRTIGATEHDCWQDDVRLWKKTWDTNAVTTLIADGTSTYNSSVLYIRPYNGENPNLGQMEVSVCNYALNINYSNVAASGHIHLVGLDVRKARYNALVVGRPATFAAIEAVDDVQIVGCRASGAGVDGSGLSGSDAIIVNGVGDAAGLRMTNLYIAGNYLTDALNNAVELSGTSGAILERNTSYNVGGYSLVELWSSNDTCQIRYNVGERSSTVGRISATNYGNGGVWFGNYYESGGSWDTDDGSGALGDATQAKNFSNAAYFNLIIAPRIKGMYATGGTEHKFWHNTVVMDGDSIYGADVGTAEGMSWRTDGVAATGFVDISNNLFYWKRQSTQRSPSLMRINNTTYLGATNSVPTGDNNIYFNDRDASSPFYYNASAGVVSTTSFTTYKAALDAYGLDRASLCGKTNAGSTLTSTAVLGFDLDTYKPLASAAVGLTSLTGIGNVYQDGQPYVAASATIGALRGS
jgi:hypothetical protein